MAVNRIAHRVALREIRLFFSSPVAWMFLAGFSAVSLFIFFWVESFFTRNTADVRPLFEWMPVLLIFLCSALTMRSWSDERRNGTLEFILTQPVSLWRFVAGKFLACLMLLLLALASTLPLPITVALIADLDWGPVIAGYLAAALLGGSYLAIGLFASARTDNPIVSLMGSVALCGALYLPGSTLLTDFFHDSTGETLRLFATGARFDSITRGVVDLRDLLYYLSLIVGFLVLNVFALEKERWANTGSNRHRHWHAGVALLLLNLVLANLALTQLPGLRLDTTEGRQFSISQPTHQLLGQLQEPLLIRGYFSAKTHPLLSPLGPRLRNLIREYEEAGKGKIKVEFVDPALAPALEEEANKRYGITTTPFQINDRHQSALVNAYFNILVRYGSSHETLGFSNLIEVHTSAGDSPEVRLRNPEYDISHAIKKVVAEYHTGGNLFDGIEQPVEFIGYVSADHLLPEVLQAYKQSIAQQLEVASQRSGGKFSLRFLQPEARGGIVAKQIAQEWGFKPMMAELQKDQQFYFYLTLADAQQVVQLPTDNFDATAFRLTLDAGLKRFARGFTRTVALSVPAVDPQMSRYHLGAPTFVNLKRAISRNYNLREEDLSDGSVTSDADILAVVAPHLLDNNSVFAIDQFLMRGGTVILATSPFTTQMSGGQLELKQWNSGLQTWLKHHGLAIADTLVLDKQNTPFAAPINRRTGEHEFKDVQIIDYPYFLNLRPPGLNPDHPLTANLPSVTIAWASPIVPQTNNSQRRITTLLKSSQDAWTSDSAEIMPQIINGALSNLKRPQAPTGSKQYTEETVGLVVQGRFDSFFASRESTADNATFKSNPFQPTTQIDNLLQRSPEAARIVLYASNDFMDDQILKNVVATTGTGFLSPVELFLNTLGWALKDDQLLPIRSRAHFNRTLPTMERKAQTLLEYFNYGLAILWLLALALVGWLQQRRLTKRYLKNLSP